MLWFCLKICDSRYWNYDVFTEKHVLDTVIMYKKQTNKLHIFNNSFLNILIFYQILGIWRGMATAGYNA